MKGLKDSTFRPWGWDRIWFNRVVFPDPKYPVKTVTCFTQYSAALMRSDFEMNKRTVTGILSSCEFILWSKIRWF